jgi:hypothetical protein
MAKIYASKQVREVRELYEDLIHEISAKTKIKDWLQKQVDILWDAYKSGDHKIIAEVSNFHPELIGASAESVMAHTLTYREIENIIMEQYGYITWDDAASQGKFNTTFERAVSATLSGDVERMRELLMENPELVNEHSQFGHKANLIQYLGANGTEIWRQIISINIVEMLELLIEQGADPDAPNNIYGGSNLRTLIETSEHTFQSGQADKMLEKLAVYGY